MDETLRKIWWIASFPKSGNTYVRMFLNAYVTKFPLDINSCYQYATIDQQPQWYQHVAAKPLEECHPAEVAYLRPAMLMHYLQVVSPADACFKTHNANVEIDGIQLIPTRLTKQAVYLVRDPRDVAVSYALHSGISIDDTIRMMTNNQHVGNRGRGICDVILSWSSHVDSWDPERCKFPCQVFRYEDLVADPESTFREILPALGFRRIDEESFQFALQQTEFGQLQRQEQLDGFRERKHSTFFRVGKSGQWKDQLTPRQIQDIEKNHRCSMERHGYLPSRVGV